MADSDRTLEVLIKLGYVGADQADAAREALAGIKQETGALNQSLPEGSALFEKYKNVLGETGGASLSARESAHLLHLTLRNMGAEIPGLGMLLRGLFNPVTLGAAAGIAAEEIYFNWLKKREEKYHDLLAVASKINDSIKEIFASSKSADDQFVEFTKTMAEAREYSRGLAADLERDAQFADAAREAADAAAERMAALHENTANTQTRLVDMLQTLGTLTGPQADQMKAQIEHQEKVRKLTDEQNKAAADVAQKKSELGKAREDVAGYGPEDQAFKAKQMADATAERAESIIAKFNGIQGQLDLAIGATAGAAQTHGMDSKAYADAKKIEFDLRDQSQRMTEQYNQAKLDLPIADQRRAAADKAWTDLEASKDAVKKLTQELDKLQQKLAEVTAATGPKIQAENQQFGLDYVNNLAKQGVTPAQIVQQAAEAMNAINRETRQWGESAAQITASGQGAMAKRDNLAPGQQLSGTDQQAIDRYELLQKQQSQVDALRELYAALNFNGDAILGNINSAVATLGTQTAIHRATRIYIATVETELRGELEEIKKQTANLPH